MPHRDLTTVTRGGRKESSNDSSKDPIDARRAAPADHFARNARRSAGRSGRVRSVRLGGNQAPGEPQARQGRRRRQRSRGRPRPAERPASAQQVDARERDPGQPRQRDRPAPDLPGRRACPRQPQPDRAGLVRPARRLRRRPRARSWRQLRAEARQHRDRRPGSRADGHRGQPVAAGEPVRAGRDPFPGRARLQPDADRCARPDRLPADELPARRRRRPRLQPVHPDRGLRRRLQRADHRGRQRRRSTSSTTPTPPIAFSASTSPAPQRPASSPSPRPTCCSSRDSTPASRSSTSAPTPASR